MTRDRDHFADSLPLVSAAELMHYLPGRTHNHWSTSSGDI